MQRLKYLLAFEAQYCYTMVSTINLRECSCFISEKGSYCLTWHLRNVKHFVFWSTHYVISSSLVIVLKSSPLARESTISAVYLYPYIIYHFECMGCINKWPIPFFTDERPQCLWVPPKARINTQHVIFVVWRNCFHVQNKPNGVRANKKRVDIRITCSTLNYIKRIFSFSIYIYLLLFFFL